MNLAGVAARLICVWLVVTSSADAAERAPRPISLREALQLHSRSFPESRRQAITHLDVERGVALIPDLTWRADGRPIFAGYCKYKRPTGTVPNADVYQMRRVSYAPHPAIPDRPRIGQ